MISEIDKEHLKRAAENKLLRDIENKPCACGKRKRAKPQKILKSDFEIKDGPLGLESRLVCRAQCGVCQQIHKAMVVQLVARRLLSG